MDTIRIWKLMQIKSANLSKSDTVSQSRACFRLQGKREGKIVNTRKECYAENQYEFKVIYHFAVKKVSPLV